ALPRPGESGPGPAVRPLARLPVAVRRMNRRLPMRPLTALRRPARAARTHRSVTVLAVATLAVATLAGYAWYGLHAAQQRDRTAHACVVAATPAAQAVFSYDYRTFDASIANGRAFITGPFANE